MSNQPRLKAYIAAIDAYGECQTNMLSVTTARQIMTTQIEAFETALAAEKSTMTELRITSALANLKHLRNLRAKLG